MLISARTIYEVDRKPSYKVEKEFWFKVAGIDLGEISFRLIFTCWGVVCYEPQDDRNCEYNLDDNTGVQKTWRSLSDTKTWYPRVHIAWKKTQGYVKYIPKLNESTLMIKYELLEEIGILLALNRNSVIIVVFVSILIQLLFVVFSK